MVADGKIDSAGVRVSPRAIVVRVLRWYIPFVIFGLVSSGTVSHRLRDNARARTLSLQREHLNSLARQISWDLEGAAADVEILSGLPCLADVSAERLAKARESFKTFATAKPHLLQLRLIAADGLELVVVERQGAEIVVLPREALEQKSDRYYVQAMQRLSVGDMYVSRLDLNVEDSVIEVPHRPMLRIGQVMSDGERPFFLVLNYDAKQLVTHEWGPQSGYADRMLMVLDDEGRWLREPTELPLDGAGAPLSVGEMFPELWAALQSGATDVETADALYSSLWVKPLIAPNIYRGTGDTGRWRLLVSTPRSHYGLVGPWFNPGWRVVLFLVLFGAGLLFSANAWLALRRRAMGRALEKADQARAESDARLQHFFDQELVGMLTVDTDGRLHSFNDFLCRLTGRTRAELLGLSFNELLYEQAHETPAFTSIMQHAETGGTVKLTLVSGEGVAHVLLQVVTADEEDVAFTALVVDVTARHRAQDLLQRAQRLEALGTLAGGIAHDFNNMLGAIIGHVELAQLAHEDGESCADDLIGVARAADRARLLTRQILTFSRHGDRAREMVNLVDVLDEVESLLRASLPANVALSIQGEGTYAVQGDPTELHQVVLNLCTNAAHALGARGGRLDVALVKRSAPPVGSKLPAGAYVELTVRDDGVGMSEAVQQHIFDPFYTTKKVGHGTGLGLAMVYRILARCGGTVTVESRVGEGSTFTVVLPLMEGTLVSAPSALAGPLPKGQGERIFVVEDEAMLCRTVCRMLAGLGYRVDSVASAEAALFRLGDAEVHADLVLTDQTMPGLSGMGLLEALQTLRPGLPVLVCTGYSPTVDAETAIAQGAAGFLLKPVGREALAYAVRAALDTSG